MIYVILLLMSLLAYVKILLIFTVSLFAHLFHIHFNLVTVRLRSDF